MSLEQSDIKEKSNQFQIEMPQVSVIGNVEIEFETFYRNNGSKIDDLVISFSEIAYIDISAMVYLISITYQRNIEKKITRYVLPNNENTKKNNILIILHTWRFFEILKEITGKSVQEYLLNPESFENIIKFSYEKNSDGNQEEIIQETTGYINLSKDYFNKFYKNDEGLKTLHFDKDFFPLISKPFGNYNEQIQTLNNMLEVWDENSIIVSTLENSINRNKSDETSNVKQDDSLTDSEKDSVISSVLEKTVFVQGKLKNNVVKESITNAIRHPNADLLITGAYYDMGGKCFTLVIWDNGDSIIKSLKNGLELNGTIKVDNLENIINGLNPSYFCTDGSENSKNSNDIDFDKKLFFTDDIPSLDDPEWRFLLASFYPGVTSKPKDPEVFQDLVTDKTGMGLTVLLETIIKDFGGKVSVRIDNFNISIKRIENQFLNALYRKKHDSVFLQPLLHRYKRDNIPTYNSKKTSFVYQVKIRENKCSPQFKGNMLTLRIPLK